MNHHVMCGVLALLLTGCGGNPQSSSSLGPQVYEVTIPPDQGDGYLTVDVTGVQGRARLAGFVEGDLDRIGLVVSPWDGADLHTYFSVAAGKKYTFEVSAYTGLVVRPGIAHTFSSTFVPAVDVNEPNDGPDHATELVGDTAQGLLTMPIVDSAMRSESLDDWFEVTAQSARLKVTLEPPENVEGLLALWKFDAERDSVSDANPAGQKVVASVATEPGQVWRIQVGALWNAGAIYGGGPVPANFTQPYTLRVEHLP